MSADEKFDVIVVGAGPAGSACAYRLASSGKNVLLIERGTTPGCKNVTGGRLYTYALEMLEKDIYKDAPLQRKVVKEQIMMLGDDNSTVTVDYLNYDFGVEVPKSYTVLRASFDEWLAQKAEAAGAALATGILVDDLIIKNGQVIGVSAMGEEMYADIVVAADGVNSILAQKAGLIGDIKHEAVGVGVKEVIELPKDVIEARFNLEESEGAACVALGCTEGISGGAFMYTNSSSVSLGIVFNPAQAAKNGKSIHEIMQNFKAHKAIAGKLKGGKSVEYSAHLVPELGLSGMPKQIHMPGFLMVGDAAGLGINTGLIIRGIDLAIVSGIAAADAIGLAKDVPHAGVEYINQLNERLLIPTMKQLAGWHKIFDIPRLFKEYPLMANDIFRFLFTVDGNVPEKTLKALRKIMKSYASIPSMASDAWKIFKAI